MISFKTREDVLPSALILISVVAVVGVLIYCLLFPVPDANSTAQSASAQLRFITADIGKSNEQANLYSSAVAARIWNGDENHVGADILAMVTTNTTSDGVKLAAFRPQRTIDLGGVTELPYSIDLSGPYKGVRSVLRSMDSSKSKVVLQSIQVSASEEVTGSVTSTLVIAAYIKSDTTVVPSVDVEGN